MRSLLEILIFVFTTGILPVIINKSTESGRLDWIKQYLRPIWALIFILYFVYLLQKPEVMEVAMNWHKKWSSSPLFGFLLVGAIGAAIFCCYWWIIGLTFQTEQPKQPMVTKEVAKVMPEAPTPTTHKKTEREVKLPASTSPKDKGTMLTNSELRDKVIAFSNVMRDFEHNFKSREIERDMLLPPLNGTPEQQAQMRKERSARELERYTDYENEFRRKYLAEAINYRLELYRRLKADPPKDEFVHIVALTGRLAGPTPVNDLATWLERLARQLPSD